MCHNSILKVNNLNLDLVQQRKKYKALENINFTLEKGKTLGIIGESGSGKSLTCSSIMGLLDSKKWNISGNIDFKNTPLPYNNNKVMNKFRGKHIALITQNPMNAFNPLKTISYHFVETLREHDNISKKEIEKKAIDILEQMHIVNPEKVLNSYSYELSGGMLQRIMIALAVILEPEILIADEPTTALDLTVQQEIIKILWNIQNKYNTSIILVSHDLNIISQLADEVLVVYGGHIVEKGPVEDILNNPKHPYTEGLIKSRPRFSKDRLQVLEGSPPTLFERNEGCSFYNRCESKSNKCMNNIPNVNINSNHEVKCCLFKEVETTIGTA